MEDRNEYFYQSRQHIKYLIYKFEEYLNGKELDNANADPYIDGLLYTDQEEAAEYVLENHRTLPNRNRYSNETIAEIKKGIDILQQAYTYASHIDWLLSWDCNEESFHKELKKDLNELEKECKSDGYD